MGRSNRNRRATFCAGLLAPFRRRPQSLAAPRNTRRMSASSKAGALWARPSASNKAIDRREMWAARRGWASVARAVARNRASAAVCNLFCRGKACCHSCQTLFFPRATSRYSCSRAVRWRSIVRSHSGCSSAASPVAFCLMIARSTSRSCTSPKMSRHEADTFAELAFQALPALVVKFSGQPESFLLEFRFLFLKESVKGYSELVVFRAVFSYPFVHNLGIAQFAQFAEQSLW